MTDETPRIIEPEALAAARGRLEACADDLENNAINLRNDTRPDEPNADVHYRVADEREQWGSDLRAILASHAQLEAALKGILHWRVPHDDVLTVTDGSRAAIANGRLALTPESNHDQ